MKSPIREMREQLGLTQSKFRLALHCGQATLSMIENGLTEIGDKVAVALEELHINTAEVIELQRQFVAAKREEVCGEIRAMLSGGHNAG